MSRIIGPTLGASLAVAVDIGWGRAIAWAALSVALGVVCLTIRAAAGIKGGAK